MQIEIHLSQIEQLAVAVQVLSTLPQTDTGLIKMMPVVCQPKSLPQHEATKKHHRDVQVVRMVDNTLQCKGTSQTIPSTHRGGIDLAKLDQEIHLGKWDLN